MKELFDKNRYRLSDSEKAEVWRKISLNDPPRRTMRRTWLAPTLGVTAVAVFGFIFLYVSLPRLADPGGYRGHSQTISRIPQDQAPVQDGKRETPPELPAGAVPVRGQPDEAKVAGARDGMSTRQAQPGTAGDAGKGVVPENEIWSAIKKTDSPTAVALGELEEGNAVTLPEEDDQSTAAVTPEARQREPETYAVDSVEEALSDKEALADQAGITLRAGEVHVRGGRSSEVEFDLDAPAVAETPAAAAMVSGYSTFSLAADNASYLLTRESLQSDRLPPVGSIRVQDFINHFEPGYPPVAEGDLTIHADGAPSPFRPGKILLRIGVKGRAGPDQMGATGEISPGIPLMPPDAASRVDFDLQQVRNFRLLESSAQVDTKSAPAGVEQQVVALYEIQLEPSVAGILATVDSSRTRGGSQPVALARVQMLSEHIETERLNQTASFRQEVTTDVLARDFKVADPHLQLAVIAAEFAEILQDRSTTSHARLSELEQMLTELAPSLAGVADVGELTRMIQQASALLQAGSVLEE